MLSETKQTHTRTRASTRKHTKHAHTHTHFHISPQYPTFAKYHFPSFYFLLFSPLPISLSFLHSFTRSSLPLTPSSPFFLLSQKHPNSTNNKHLLLCSWKGKRRRRGEAITGRRVIASNFSLSFSRLLSRRFFSSLRLPLFTSVSLALPHSLPVLFSRLSFLSFYTTPPLYSTLFPSSPSVLSISFV